MANDSLLALSPLDGRYAAQVEPLGVYLSEFALIRDRVGVEIAYLRALGRAGVPARPLTPSEDDALLDILRQFSLADANRVRALEETTRHDVKAVEYFLRERMQGSLRDAVPWLHFGLTSEDINQTAIASALLESRDRVMLPELERVLDALREFAAQNRSLPMLARTHGQAAVPTTLGKEFANVYARLRHQAKRLRAHTFTAKLAGAVGNFNAHTAAAPQVDWLALSRDLLHELGLEAWLANTQLMPYDNWLEYFDALRLTNSILLDLAQDVWRYLSDGWLEQAVRESEVGSSTMPQKVNPIEFENAEGNLGIANAHFEFYARKLPGSRLQRDLSDSTVRRTFGVALGHTLVGWQNIRRGMAKLAPVPAQLAAALDAHWEIVAEGAQTILRAAGIPGAYEQLKTLTRGKTLTRDGYLVWVDTLALPDAVRAQLRALSPQTYLGLAETLTDQILNER